jgi:multidrug transporter EmrE-like cation transporter
MTRHGLLMVVFSALCTVVANLMIRAGILSAGGFNLSLNTLKSQTSVLVRQPLFLGGFIIYAVAAIIWFRVLSTENLSTSYPLLISLTFLLVTVGASFFFHEQISLQKVLGLTIILAGIVVVASA